MLLTLLIMMTPTLSMTMDNRIQDLEQENSHLKQKVLSLEQEIEAIKKFIKFPPPKPNTEHALSMSEIRRRILDQSLNFSHKIRACSQGMLAMDEISKKEIRKAQVLKFLNFYTHETCTKESLDHHIQFENSLNPQMQFDLFKKVDPIRICAVNQYGIDTQFTFWMTVRGEARYIARDFEALFYGPYYMRQPDDEAFMNLEGDVSINFDFQNKTVQVNEYEPVQLNGKYLNVVGKAEIYLPEFQ